MPSLGPTEIIIIAVVLVLLLGWKKLPDVTRSVGRSMRIFKSEVNEMKNDGKSAASQDTVKGETVRETPVRETPVHDTTVRNSDGGAIREDNSPRTDNQSGPAA